MVMEVSAACHKNEGSWDAMRRFCLLENEGKTITTRRAVFMKKARRSLMALGVAVFSLSAILTGRMKEKPVLAQLNCQKAVPITSRWADDTHIFSSFDD